MAGDVAALRKDNPVALLEEKFIGWVTQQPEWLAIVAMPRQQRRASMKELANRLYTIPVMDGTHTVPRQVKRKVAKELSHAVRTGQLDQNIQEALLKAAVNDAAEKFADEQKAVEEFQGDDDPTPFEGSVPIVGVVEPLLDPEGEVKSQLYPENGGEMPPEPEGLDQASDLDVEVDTQAEHEELGGETEDTEVEHS